MNYFKQVPHSDFSISISLAYFNSNYDFVPVSRDGASNGMLTKIE